MTASDYPITFPYGSTSFPYSQINPHRGNDRKMPIGTPVVVCGTIIGFSGNTGESLAPHLHNQVGTDQEVQKTINPTGHEFKPGTVVAIRYTDSGQWGKFVTIRNEDGTYITYAHLSEVKVKVGQVIKGESMDKPTQKQVYDHFHAYDVKGDLANGDPSQKQLDYYSGNSWSVLYLDLLNYNHDRRKELEAVAKPVALKTGIYQVK